MAFMSQEEAIAKAEADAQAKRDAARRMVAGAGPAVPSKLVTVRVMKLGHDKISMGQHVGGFGDAYYERGDSFAVAQDIAEALEARGFVEIEGEYQPPIPQLEQGSTLDPVAAAAALAAGGDADSAKGGGDGAKTSRGKDAEG